MSSMIPETPKQTKTSTSYQYLPTPATNQKQKQQLTNTTTPKTINFPFTPTKSPSKHRHKKHEIVNNERISFGLFLPTTSTIGSGRKLNNLSIKGKLKQAAELDKNITTDEIQCEQEPEFKTPGKQIITKDIVNEWNEEKDDGVEIIDQEKVNEIPRAKLKNPFIDDGEDRHIDKMSSKNECDIDYNTHMELINNKTGKKKILKLTKNQMKIKPKKLSFENC
ncbi:unnamed protein product [Candida verbasci]|uniref:Uncharacterized protein n=1 Tax=Candida verbasci TaxID=1227364 RepID=A0A9W4TXR2_9ASCO|nr:unnamed protein product [Candida verbasci]